MTVKITSFEAENVKRIKAVQLEPSPTGLTVIGGRNNQGKTSVLDAIAWALGGNKLKPSDPHRAGSVADPEIKITLSNGLVVERKGKKSDLKVTDPSGKKSGQSLLDSLVGEMALNIPKFMEMNSKDKARAMLQRMGISAELAAIDKEREDLATERLVIGRQARAKEEALKTMERYPEVGDELWSASQLIEQQQAILLKNAENARKRTMIQQLEQDFKRLNADIEAQEARLTQMKNSRSKLMSDLEIAKKDAMDLYDESTEELQKNIAEVDLHNQQVRANQSYKQAEQQAEELRNYHKSINCNVMDLEKKRLALLQGANLPLPGLSVNESAELIYNGQRWDNMSASDQLKVAAAICQEMNPNCGFVLMDKLEQMDQQTMAEFSQWLESRGLQVIATRVSTGDECSIIIEDGSVKGQERDYCAEQIEQSQPSEPAPNAWSSLKWS